MASPPFCGTASRTYFSSIAILAAPGRMRPPNSTTSLRYTAALGDVEIAVTGCHTSTSCRTMRHDVARIAPSPISNPPLPGAPLLSSTASLSQRPAALWRRCRLLRQWFRQWPAAGWRGVAPPPLRRRFQSCAVLLCICTLPPMHSHRDMHPYRSITLAPIHLRICKIRRPLPPSRVAARECITQIHNT